MRIGTLVSAALGALGLCFFVVELKYFGEGYEGSWDEVVLVLGWASILAALVVAIVCASVVVHRATPVAMLRTPERPFTGSGDPRVRTGLVSYPRQAVGADDERVPAAAGGNQLRSRGQRIGEPRARGEKVVPPGMRRPDAVLDEARGARKQRIGRGRADDDEVDVLRGQAGAANGLLRGFGRQVGRGDAGVDDMALTDARSLENPLVARIDHLFEVEVGQHFFGKPATGRSDFDQWFRSLHAFSVTPPADEAARRAEDAWEPSLSAL